MPDPGREYGPPWVRCGRCGCLRPTDHLKWDHQEAKWFCVEVEGFCARALRELEARNRAVTPP